MAAHDRDGCGRGLWRSSLGSGAAADVSRHGRSGGGTARLALGVGGGRVASIILEREREMNRNRNKRRENEREGGRQISKIQNRYNNEKLQKQLCVHSYAHGRMAYIYTYTYMPQDEKMYPQKTNIESRTKARDIF